MLKLLLIEDNPGDARLIRELLAEGSQVWTLAEPFEMRHAETLAEGLMILRDHPMDEVLLDLSLPDSQGFDTFTAVRLRAPHVPVVVLSGLADEELAIRAVRFGAQDYLVKGQVEPALLVRSLCYAVERWRAEQEHARLVREQAAHAEAEAERGRLQQVIDVLPEGVVIVDAEGRFVLCNRAGREIIGSDPVGHHLPSPAFLARGELLRRLDGSPCAAEELSLRRSLETGEVVHGQQLLLRDVPVLLNSAPLRDASGAITGAVAVFQDISRIKDLERQKDEFLASAAHDLKTPLTVIRGYAQLLRRQAARANPGGNARLERSLDNIDAAVERMARLLSEMLDATRLQMGRLLDLDPVPTDLVALARQVVAEHQATTQRHRLRLECHERELVGRWDAIRLQRVLGNLVDNAIKFSPEGGEVVVTLARGQGSRGPEAVLRVRDRGVGIPAEDLPLVFQRFHRGANVVGRIGGTGIGLAGSRQIVEQHGGTVTVESREGMGTTVTVRLPLAGPAETTSPAPAEPPSEAITNQPEPDKHRLVS